MKSEQVITEARPASYEELASEYYNPQRHPTCANFREASALLLRGWLRKYGAGDGGRCEVGAGDSLLAELLAEGGWPLEGLIITDSSPTMLGYSRKWADSGARLILAGAESLPVRSASLGLLVSSLGDPYNEPAFWGEAYRVLRPGGLVFFTTPAYEWARAFRRQSRQDEVMSAEFELLGGRVVSVPSWIYPVDEQKRMVEGSGLECREEAQVRRSELGPENLSPKLNIGGESDINIVTGYVATKAPA